MFPYGESIGFPRRKKYIPDEAGTGTNYVIQREKRKIFMEMSNMKKVISLITALLLCVSLASSVFAAEDTFVPSVPSKGAPTIVTVKDGEGKAAAGIVKDASGATTGHLYDDCLLITSVAEANTSTKISADAKTALLSVYDQLNKGTMELPYAEGIDADKMVIKDLFDVSWMCTEHPSVIASAGVTVELTFDIGVASTADVVVMTYKNGAWGEIVSVKNNGDGTITCVFEDFCPVAISIPTDANSGPSETGDNSDLVLWTVLLAASAAAVVVLVILRRRSMMSK